MNIVLVLVSFMVYSGSARHFDPPTQWAIREQGGVIAASVVVAAARRILMALNKSLLPEFGGHITLSRHWAYHLLNGMNFVQRKATTSKSKYKPADFAKIKEQFLNDVVSTVTMEEIPPELLLNWDQTGIYLVPVSLWTMEQAGSKRVEINRISSKQQITAVVCGSLTGDCTANLPRKDITLSSSL